MTDPSLHDLDLTIHLNKFNKTRHREVSTADKSTAIKLLGQRERENEQRERETEQRERETEQREGETEKDLLNKLYIGCLKTACVLEKIMANITKRRAELKIDDDAFGSLCDECGIKGLAKKSLQRSDGSHSLLLLAFSDLIEAAGGDAITNNLECDYREATGPADCSVCLGVEKLLILPCGHACCFTCFVALRQTDYLKAKACPMCRANIVETLVRRN